MTTPHHTTTEEDDDGDLCAEECIYCQHPATHCRCDAIYDQWKENQAP